MLLIIAILFIFSYRIELGDSSYDLNKLQKLMLIILKTTGKVLIGKI